MALGNFTPKRLGSIGTPNNTTLYTVPAGKGAILKRVVASGSGGQQNIDYFTVVVNGTATLKLYCTKQIGTVYVPDWDAIRDLNIALVAGDTVAISHVGLDTTGNVMLSGVEFDV